MHFSVASDDITHFVSWFDELAADVESNFTAPELGFIADDALSLVVRRTKSGVDVDHNIFHPYANGYARERIKHSLRTFPVDLARTGAMIGAFRYDVAATPFPSIRFGFSDPQQALKAKWHNEGAKGDDGRTAVNEFLRSRKESRKGRKRGPDEYALHVVSGHTRAVNLPKREWLDIRHPLDISTMEASVVEVYERRLEAALRRPFDGIPRVHGR